MLSVAAPPAADRTEVWASAEGALTLSRLLGVSPAAARGAGLAVRGPEEGKPEGPTSLAVVVMLLALATLTLTLTLTLPMALATLLALALAYAVGPLR